MVGDPFPSIVYPSSKCLLNVGRTIYTQCVFATDMRLYERGLAETHCWCSPRRCDTIVRDVTAINGCTARFSLVVCMYTHWPVFVKDCPRRNANYMKPSKSAASRRFRFHPCATLPEVRWAQNKSRTPPYLSLGVLSIHPKKISLRVLGNDFLRPFTEMANWPLQKHCKIGNIVRIVLHGSGYLEVNGFFHMDGILLLKILAIVARSLNIMMTKP